MSIVGKWVWIPGAPKTKGSLEHRGHGQMKESVVGSKQWRMLMAERFRAAHKGAAPLVGGVGVEAYFIMPTVDVTVARTGDLDKLLRNVLDALQDAGVVTDDVQVGEIKAVKRAVRADLPHAGVHVRIRYWEP